MNKTVEQLLEEVKTNETLKNDFEKALKQDKEAVVSFMRNNGCDATIEEAKTKISELSQEMIANGDLTPEQLENVSGGTDALWYFLGFGWVRDAC